MFLLHFPSVVGLEKFHEVVILLLDLHIFYLLMYGIIICGSLNIADNTEGNWESMLVVHHGELQL